MKVFDKEDLRKINKWSVDYDKEETPEIDGIKPIENTTTDIKIGGVVIINDTAFSVCSLRDKSYIDNKEKQWCTVEKLKKQEIFLGEEEARDMDYKDNIICPYCGYKDINSWEADDDEEKCECGVCGSIFSYQRVVTVEYCSQPVQKANIINLDTEC